MKPKTSYLLSVLTFMLFLSSAVSAREQEGHGGDNVEPLFISAQKEAVRIISQVRPGGIPALQINEPSKSWLSEPGRLAKFQFYVGKMKPVFQEGPCLENGYPRGTSFDNSDPASPRIVISRSLNRNTTPSQAIALVFHEAGHFVGEMDHLFLSMLGVELVEQETAKPIVFTERGTSQVSQRDYDLNFEVVKNNCRGSAQSLAMEQCYKAGFVRCEGIDVPRVISISNQTDPVVFTCTASVRGFRN